MRQSKSNRKIWFCFLFVWRKDLVERTKIVLAHGAREIGGSQRHNLCDVRFIHWRGIVIFSKQTYPSFQVKYNSSHVSPFLIPSHVGSAHL